MSRAVAAFHGHFGRATINQLNRPFNVHAHREGHLIFHVGGTRGVHRGVRGAPSAPPTSSVVAVNPWEPHNFLPRDLHHGSLFFVLYVNPDWFARRPAETLRFGRTEFRRTARSTANQGVLLPCMRRARAPRPRLGVAQPDRGLPRREPAPGRGLARGSRPAAPGLIDFRVQSRSGCWRNCSAPTSSSMRWRASQACHDRISTNCSAPRPASPQTSMSTPC